MTEAKTQHPAKRWLGPAAFVLLAVIFGAAMNDDEPAVSEPEQTSTFGEGDAILNCQDAVQRELNNPATADFSILDTEATETSGTWSIAGTMTAENDFGTEQQIAFDCTVTEGEPVQVEVTEP